MLFYSIFYIRWIIVINRRKQFAHYQRLKYNFQPSVHFLGPCFNSGLSNYQWSPECIKHDFMKSCLIYSVECYWHCSDGTVHYKSDRTVNFCGFRCATTSPITVFINFVFLHLYIYHISSLWLCLHSERHGFTLRASARDATVKYTLRSHTRTVRSNRLTLCTVRVHGM